MKRNIWRTSVWVAVLFSLGLLVLGAVALGLIVGDWLFTETHAHWLAWALGIIVIFGAVLSMGIGLGLFLYWHYPKPKKTEELLPNTEPRGITDTLETLIVAAHSDSRD